MNTFTTGGPSTRPGAGNFSPLAFGNRYEVVHLLKESNGIHTFFGRDRETYQSVVIKAAIPSPLVNPAARLRIEHEARILSLLHSPYLQTKSASGYDQHGPFLITPYVAGQTLNQRLARGPLSIEETLEMAVGVMRGLCEAHSHQVVHSDIKPDNIIVAMPGEKTKPLLIDFGFAWSLKAEDRISPGTAAYFSPEQAGLLRCTVDERSDFYSFGVVLYECLSGDCPFKAEDLGRILQKHLSFDPPALWKRRRDVPKVLDDLIHKCLRKDPRDRYQSAAGLLSDLEKILHSYLAGERDPNLVVGISDKRRVLTEPTFIGREEALKNLKDLWMETQKGYGGLVCLEAESGGGKTWLLEEFVRQIGGDGIGIFWGQGVDQSARRPFQMFARVAEGVIALGKEHPEFAERMKKGCGDKRAAVTQVLPELQSVLGENHADEAGPEDFGEIRSLQALETFLDCLGDVKAPAMILLDDCQWADAMTLRLLASWNQERQRNPESFLMVVAAFRSEEVPLGATLRRLTPRSRIVLSPFGGKEITAMINTMIGELSQKVVSLVEDLSEGSPFMVSAVVRGLVESEALVHSRNGWVLHEARLSQMSSSRRAASFLIKRMELLPLPVLELLSVAAVLGKEFSVEMAAVLAGHSLPEAVQSVEVARRRRLLWSYAEGVQYAFVHDKIREALLERIPQERKNQLHRRAAERISTETPERVFEIAFHYDCAGMSEAALPYAIKAAERARAQHSLELADKQYRIAMRGAIKADLSTRKAIQEGLGEVCLLRGSYDESAEQFEELLEVASDDEERSVINARLGEIAFKKGDVRLAAQYLELGLKLLGRWVPKSHFGFTLGCLKEAFVQMLHTLFPKIFVGRLPKEKRSFAEQTELRILSRLAYVYWFFSGKVTCAWAHFREMNLAEKYSATLELGQAYSEHGPVMTLLPWYSRGDKYVLKALEIRRNLNDHWGVGQAQHFRGVVLYASGKFEEAIDCCHEAYQIMEKAGDQWEVNAALWHSGLALYRLGELVAARDLFLKVLEMGREIGDHQAVGIALSGLARSTSGEIPREILNEELKRDAGDCHTGCELRVAEGVVYLRQDRPTEAVRSFESAVALLEKGGLRQEYVAPAYSWLATAYRLQYQKLRASTFTVGEVRRAFKKYRRTVAKAMRISYFYQNNWPHAARERALCCVLEGDIKHAKYYFQSSLSAAEKQNALAEQVLTLRARGKIGAELLWPGAWDDMTRANDIERQIGIDVGFEKSDTSNNESLAQLARFQGIMEAGRDIVTAQSQQTVLDLLQEVAAKLLGAERCFIVRQDPQTLQLTVLGTNSSREFSRNLVIKALHEKASTVFVEGPDANLSDSLLLSGVRSALAVPLFVSGACFGCLYISHKQLGTLFGEEEKRLAEFLATLAGCALETAANFEALKKLNAAHLNNLKALTATQASLEKQKAALIYSNDDLRRFAHVASHDLKEPLRMVASFLKLLEKRSGANLDAESKEYLQFAVDGANRMYLLLDGLLLYSQSSTKEQERKVVDVSKVVEGAVTNLLARVEETQAQIDVGPLPKMVGDETQLLQLFQNLIGNAMKFTKRTPVVKVSGQETMHETVYSVEDNGIGIDPKFKDRIFVIYQRLHTREEFPGTGIGLAVCKRIVERHHGRIWVESEVGQGAKFFLAFPKDE